MPVDRRLEYNFGLGLVQQPPPATTGMDDSGTRRLRNWLQKSLQNHPENENGLVAYVEAIVGNAQGTVSRFAVCDYRVRCSLFLAVGCATYSRLVSSRVISKGGQKRRSVQLISTAKCVTCPSLLQAV